MKTAIIFSIVCVSFASAHFGSLFGGGAGAGSASARANGTAGAGAGRQGGASSGFGGLFDMFGGAVHQIESK